MKKRLTKMERLTVENEVLKKTIARIEETLNKEKEPCYLLGAISSIIKYEEQVKCEVQKAEKEKEKAIIKAILDKYP